MRFGKLLVACTCWSFHGWMTLQSCVGIRMLFLLGDQTGLVLSSGSSPTPFDAWGRWQMSHRALPPLHCDTKITYSWRRNVCWVVKVNGSLNMGCPEQLNSGWREVQGYLCCVSMKISSLRSNTLPPTFLQMFQLLPISRIHAWEPEWICFPNYVN